MKLQQVIKVEIKESVYEEVRRSKRKDYSRGGFCIEETIYRVTSVLPHALLSCGHWRKQSSYEKKFEVDQKLKCYTCSRNEWEQKFNRPSS